MKKLVAASTSPLKKPENKALLAFKKEVLGLYKISGRHALPWRANQSPYRVFVSEVMLQQTQVDRVIKYFDIWSNRFQNFEDIAN